MGCAWEVAGSADDVEGRCGPTAGALTRSLCRQRPDASARIGRPGASKSQ
jgi:hypothetical protein